MDLCDFKASLVYRASSKTARAVIQRNHVLENKNKLINNIDDEGDDDVF